MKEGQISLEGKDWEEKIVSFESANAELHINHTDKIVKISHITSKERRNGHGSRLLDLIKQEYADYEIKGVAHPTDILEGNDKISDDERERMHLELYEYYRKRGFDVDEGGHVSSKPPHRVNTQ